MDLLFDTLLVLISKILVNRLLCFCKFLTIWLSHSICSHHRNDLKKDCNGCLHYLSFSKQGWNTLSKLKMHMYLYNYCVKKWCCLFLAIWNDEENQWFNYCQMRIINAQYIFYLLIMQWRWYRYMIEILVIIFEMWRCTYEK